MRLCDGTATGACAVWPELCIGDGEPCLIQPLEAHKPADEGATEASPEALRPWSFTGKGMCMCCGASLSSVRRGARFCGKKCKDVFGKRRERGKEAPYEAPGVDWIPGGAVYAVHFPTHGIVKVGYSRSSQSPATNRVSGFEGKSGHRLPLGSEERPYLLWTRAGTLKHEVWLHGHLAFLWPAAWEEKNRASEWYDVRGESLDRVLYTLESLYEATPTLSEAA